MAGIKLPFKKRYSQPQGKPVIASKWANGLLTYQTGIDKGDYVNNGGTPSIVNTPSGVARNYLGTTAITRSIPSQTNSDYTFVVRVRYQSGSQAGWTGAGAGSGGAYLLYRNSSTQLVMFHNGYAVIGTDPYSSAVGKECTIIGRVSASRGTMDVWCDGQKLATSSAGAATAIDTSIVGGYYLNGSILLQTTDDVIESLTYTRWLDDAEVVALSENIWQAYAPTYFIPNSVVIPTATTSSPWFPVGGNLAMGGMFFAASSTAIGYLSVTEKTDSLASAGVLSSFGTLSQTEKTDSLSAVGVLSSSGVLSLGEVGDIVSGVGVLSSSGSLSLSEPIDSVSSSGTLSSSGSATLTENGDYLVANGTNSSSGFLAITEQQDISQSSEGVVTENITQDGVNASVVFAGKESQGHGISQIGSAASIQISGKSSIGSISSVGSNATLIYIGKTGTQQIAYNYPPVELVLEGTVYGPGGMYVGTAKANRLKHWDGSQWVNGGIGTWNGSTWI